MNSDQKLMSGDKCKVIKGSRTDHFKTLAQNITTILSPWAPLVDVLRTATLAPSSFNLTTYLKDY